MSTTRTRSVFVPFTTTRSSASWLADWNDTIRTLGRRQGWDFDSVKDLPRVLRVPGTLNHKSDPPQRVRLLEYHPDRYYNPSDFDAFLLPLEPLSAPQVISVPPTTPSTGHGCAFASDEALLIHARAARNGDKFRALFDAGDLTRYGGDHSAADLALCRLLAFWLNRDAAAIDRLFRRSKLMREKWDERHSGDGDTYGQMTIRTALASTPAGYTPRAQLEDAALQQVLALVLAHPDQLAEILDPYTTSERRQILDAIAALDGRHRAHKALKAHAAQLASAIFPAVTALEAQTGDGLREIHTTNRPLRAIGQDTVQALAACNIPPALFQQQGRLVRMRIADGLPRVDGVDVPMLMHYASKSANFLRHTAKGVSVHTDPPRNVLHDVLARADWPFPPLRAVSRCPILRPDGSLCVTPGYDTETGIYYAPPAGGDLPAIPTHPTKADVEAALSLLAETVHDFPFMDPPPVGMPSFEPLSPHWTSSYAHWVAFVLTPLLRPVLTSPTPLCLIDATQPGTGKGLLAALSSLIVTGHVCVPTPWPLTEEEMEKKLLALLLDSQQFIVFDNVEARLTSGVLCSVLTAYPEWTARMLGQSMAVRVTNTATWAVTGNNIMLGGDMPRRTYRICLDPRTATPWERTGFRHPDLLKWASAHRGALLAACFTLIRAWYAADCPAPQRSKPLGSFEDWHHHVAGILEFVGITEFLGSQAACLDRYDDERPQWERFLLAWVMVTYDATTKHSTPFPTKTLVDMLTQKDLVFDEVIPTTLAEALDGPRASVLRKVGNALAKIEYTRFGTMGLYVERTGRRQQGAVMWRVCAEDGWALQQAIRQAQQERSGSVG